MGKRMHLSRALMISCIVHAVMLVLAGWWCAGFFAPAESAECVELDLASDTVMQQAPDNDTANPASSVPAAAPAANVAVSADNSRTAVSATAAVVDSDVVSTEVPAAAVAAVAGGASSEGGSQVSGTAGAAGTAGPAAPVVRRISPPRILQKVEPVYPDDLRAQGREGSVAVKMEVLENGRPGSAWVQRSSGYTAFDEAALQAVRQWKFVPARDESSGTALRCNTVLSVVFRLR